MRRFIVAVLIVGIFLSPAMISSARGGSNSIITLGFGAELGLSRHTQPGQESGYGFLAELTMRLRLFRFLGASFAYNLGRAAETGELSFTSKFRLTALLYLLPTERVSVYVLGGFGSRDIREIVSYRGGTTSYHVGAGIEVYVGRRLAFHADYQWVIPGYSSIQQALDRRTEEAIHALEIETAEGETSSTPTQQRLPYMSFSDCLDAGNFQVTLGVRVYL